MQPRYVPAKSWRLTEAPRPVELVEPLPALGGRSRGVGVKEHGAGLVAAAVARREDDVVARAGAVRRLDHAQLRLAPCAIAFVLVGPAVSECQGSIQLSPPSVDTARLERRCVSLPGTKPSLQLLLS